MPPSLQLLFQRRFGPLFAVQFLGAFNDNVFKQALIILFATRAAEDPNLNRDFLVNLASGLLILPFFLFSATAGQVADKVEKSRLVVGTKILEVGIMLVAAFVLPTGAVYALLGLLFLMGFQSTVFGPVKYGILPQVLREDELVRGNGLVEMGTYLAILGGTLLGGLLAAQPSWGETAVAITVVALALVGTGAAMLMPKVPSPEPDLKIGWNPFLETYRIVGYALESRPVWLSILGNSWFWLFGALFLAQIPGFVEDVVGGDPTVVTLLLIAFSVGIGVGSILCDRLSSGHVELGLVPFGSIGMTVFAVDLYFATAWHTPSPTPLGPMEVLSDSGNWRWMVDLILLGVFGGFYSVPLNAIIQHRADPEKRSRIIAANNVLNALFIVAAALLAIGGLSAGMTIPQLFLAAGLANALVALYIYTLLPEFLLRFLIWILMSFMYRLRVVGAERIPSEGAAVLVCNHVSYVDALLLLAGARRPLRFIMWYKIFGIPVMNWAFRTMKAIPIASAKEKPGMAAKALDEAAAALENGELVCIFPEGGLTKDGELLPFRPGVEKIVDRTPVPVIPMALRGLWGSWFSRRGGPAMAKRPRRFRAHLELIVGEPIAPEEARVERLTELVRELRGDDLRASLQPPTNPAAE